MGTGEVEAGPAGDAAPLSGPLDCSALGSSGGTAEAASSSLGALLALSSCGEFTPLLVPTDVTVPANGCDGGIVAAVTGDAGAGELEPCSDAAEAGGPAAMSNERWERGSANSFCGASNSTI
jgi:hypothetical protein